VRKKKKMDNNAGDLTLHSLGYILNDTKHIIGMCMCTSDMVNTSVNIYREIEGKTICFGRATVFDIGGVGKKISKIEDNGKKLLMYEIKKL